MGERPRPSGRDDSGARRNVPDRVRVMFLLPAFDIGGAERVVARLASRLDVRRYDVTVAGFVEGTGRLLSELARAGVRTAVLAPRAASRARLLYVLWRCLAREKPHALMTYMFHANQSARLIGRATGIPIIVCSERVVGWESRLRVLTNRITAPLATALTTNSEVGRVFWRRRLGKSADGMRVIYNGVDLRQFKPAAKPGGVVTLGTLARLHHQNGHAWLLRGLHELARTVPTQWRYLVAGDGPEASALRTLVGELNLESRVEFVGHIDDPARFLHLLHIYVQPSLVAGMPNAVLEAMACGLPVVASAAGGTVEAVEEGVTGRLVATGGEHAMATALTALINDPSMASRMGVAGRERVQREFSLEAMVDATQLMIDDLVQQRLGWRYEDERWSPDVRPLA